MKKKMLISITLIFCLLLSYITPFSVVFAADDVPDPEPAGDTVLTLNVELYKGIRDNMIEYSIPGIYNDAQRTLKLTPEAVEQVTTLKLSNYGIRDLTGLGAFHNVKYLDLSANELSENSHLDEINNLVKLSEPEGYLDLSSNEIRSLASVNKALLQSIPTLNLHNQKFEEVNFITLDVAVDSDQPTIIEYDLPEILQWGTEIDTKWIYDYSDPRVPNTVEQTPYINWTPFRPDLPEKIEVVVGDDSGNAYQPY